MIHIKHDPIEKTDKYKRVVVEVDRKALQRVNEMIQSQIDDCKDESEKEFILSLPISHRFAFEKKQILKDEYGIEWKSTIELNPDINFD
jgi:hypothetical protein